MESIKAIVKGQYQYPDMKQPEQFKMCVEFTLYPPKENEPHYGTGCYMGVDFSNWNDAYVDVRYTGTKDLKKLAEMYIKNYWGDNLREYEFI